MDLIGRQFIQSIPILLEEIKEPKIHAISTNEVTSSMSICLRLSLTPVHRELYRTNYWLCFRKPRKVFVIFFNTSSKREVLLKYM